MNLQKILLPWAVAIAFAQPGVAVAASDIFMCAEGIDGGSTDTQFEGCSEVFGISYSVGIEGDVPPPAGAGSRPPPAACGSYVVSKPLDTASIPLMIQSLVQRTMPHVEFPVRTRGDEPVVFFQLTLTNVLIVRVEQNLDGQANQPLESIVMQPGRVEWQFTPVDAEGKPTAPVSSGFDCVRKRIA